MSLRRRKKDIWSSGKDARPLLFKEHFASRNLIFLYWHGVEIYEQDLSWKKIGLCCRGALHWQQVGSQSYYSQFKINESQQQLNKILECVQCFSQHSHRYWSVQLNVYSLTIPSHASELSLNQNTLYFNSTRAFKGPVALGRWSCYRE